MTKSWEKLEADSKVGLANPQMPNSGSPFPAGRPQEIAKFKELEFVGAKANMPSWDDLEGRPHFKIGIVVNASSTNDRHIYAIAKPATPCSLSSVVVLNPEEGEDREKSMEHWLTENGMRTEASSINFRWGQEGLKGLLESDIDAVYIIVPPG